MLGKHHASELHPTESEQNLEKRVDGHQAGRSILKYLTHRQSSQSCERQGYLVRALWSLKIHGFVFILHPSLYNLLIHYVLFCPIFVCFIGKVDSSVFKALLCACY
jgi:hypothetical protein